MIPLAAQPSQKGSFQEVGIKPVRFGTTMLARHGDARRVDHVRFDAVCFEPARQPEAVATGLEGHGNARDLVACPHGVGAPTMQQLEKGTCVGLQLLERLAFDTRHDACDEAARQAHLDHGDQRTIHIQRRKGPAQVIGAPSYWLKPASMDASSSPPAP